MSSSKGWFNLETAGGAIPETQFFEGESAFKALGLTRTQRLYGFAGSYVTFFVRSFVSSRLRGVLAIPLLSGFRGSGGDGDDG